MVRILTISVALASFQVVPALCLGGVIKHACECAVEAACDCKADCDDGSGCGHEGDCAGDPCSVQAVRTGRHSDDVVSVSPHVVSTTIIHLAVTQPPIQTERAGAHEWPGSRNLSLPSGDLPLLI